jgi:hypothetical protein
LADLRFDPDALLDELSQGNSEPLRRWLAGVGVDVAAIRGLAQWNSDPREPASGPRHRRLPPDFGRRVGEVMVEAFRKTVELPLGAALLCCYVRQVCEDAWKNSYHFDRMWATLRGARQSWQVDGDNARTETDRAVTDAMAVLLEVLDWEIAVENEMIGNNPERLAAVAQLAADRASEAAVAAEQVRSSSPEFADFIAGVADASHRFNAALATAGRSLHTFFERGDADPRALDGALRALAEAEMSVVCDRDQRSELRTYRRSLESLKQQAEADWLHIDDGTVVHVYPFAVRGIRPDEVVERVRANGSGWQLAGIRPTIIHDRLDLDDVWNGSDALGRRYEGAVVVLPDVTITDLDGRPLGQLTAEVRLSLLGNHHLHLQADLRDASAHDTYGAILQSAPEHAEVQVRCGESGTVWPRLSTFAVEVIESLGERLGGLAAISVRPGMFHVLVTVLESSVGRGPRAPRDQRRTIGTTEELLTAVGGQILLQPVPTIIGAPAEWIRFPPPESDLTLDVVSRSDEMIGHTCNTTLIAALGSPAYWITTREQVAEFVASLDGLFAGWFDELAKFLARVTEYTGGFDRPADDQDLKALTHQAALVEHEQMRLYAFAADARSTLDLIRSPALVASPLVARTLVALLDAAGLDRREAELIRNIDAVLDERLGHWLETLVRRRQEREAEAARARERQQRIWLDTMLAVLAAVGLSGLGQIYQAGYDVRRINAVWLIGTIVAFMVVFGLIVARISRKAHRPGQRSQANRPKPVSQSPTPPRSAPGRAATSDPAPADLSSSTRR